MPAGLTYNDGVLDRVLGGRTRIEQIGVPTSVRNDLKCHQANAAPWQGPITTRTGGYSIVARGGRVARICGLRAVIAPNKDVTRYPFKRRGQVSVSYSFLEYLATANVKVDTVMEKLETIQQIPVCLLPPFGSQVPESGGTNIRRENSRGLHISGVVDIILQYIHPIRCQSGNNEPFDNTS